MPQRGRQLSGLLRREPQDAPRGAVEPVAVTALSKLFDGAKVDIKKD